MPTPHKNTEIEFEGQRYEVFWKSQFAWHVAQNYLNPDHRITHPEIGDLLTRVRVVTPERGGRLGFVGLFRGVAYLTIVTLVPGTNRQPGRCVVHTSYRARDQKYIRLLNQANLTVL